MPPLTAASIRFEDGPSRLVSMQGSASARYVGPIEFGVDSAVPLVHTRSEPLLNSRFGVGSQQGLLRYVANYHLVPGDLFPDEAPMPGGELAPTRLGVQRLGQNVRLRLPPLGGAPVSLGFSTENREVWTIAGNTVGHQRQVANLAWSPPRANFNLQWMDGNTPVDPQLALGCGLHGSVRVPLLRNGPGMNEALRVWGRDCQVVGAGPYFSSLGAQTWGLAYVWNRPERETELLLSAIEPVWRDGVERQDIDSSYEFGLRHRRDYGPWIARGLVAMRYATAWDLSQPELESGFFKSDSDAYWMFNASLSRQLPIANLSANWAHGADPMWFMPQIGQRRQRIGMAIDLSRVMGGLLPDTTTQAAMHWNWHQARSRTGDSFGDNVVRLNMAVMW